jgi:hypothetical protein
MTHRRSCGRSGGGIAIRKKPCFSGDSQVQYISEFRSYFHEGVKYGKTKCCNPDSDKIAGIFLCVPSCYGGLVIVQFTAEVTHVSDDYGLLQGRINIGDTITGTYTYDTSMPDAYPNPSAARYEYYAPPSGISVEAGGFLSRSDHDNTAFFVEIEDDAQLVSGTRDTFRLASQNNLPFGSDVFVDKILLGFEDYSGHALSNDALPTVAPILTDWPLAEIEMGGYDPEHGRRFFTFEGNITSASLIPEPATFGLLGLGGLALLRNGRSVRGQHRR